MSAALACVARNGCTWQQLQPGISPSWSTAHRRFIKWSRARGWGTVHHLVLHERGARGGLGWPRYAIDSAIMRTLMEESAGSIPADSGKKRSMIALIAERTGVPFSVGSRLRTSTTAKGWSPWFGAAHPSGRLADRAGVGLPGRAATRATPSPRCVRGCALATSLRAAAPRGSNPLSAMGGTVRPRSPPVPGAPPDPALESDPGRMGGPRVVQVHLG